MPDAIVVGSGPNGLAAAITLARAGRRVHVLEAQPTIGGAVRSAALTLPGFIHDLASASHPLGAGSPFFRTLPLAEHGLKWIAPPVALAHPLDDGTAAALSPSFEQTCATLGEDGAAWRRLLEPFARRWDALGDELLRPMIHLPRHPLLLASFGLLALQSATGFARRMFRGEAARALFGGLAAHSFLPLESTASASFALVLAAAGHAVDWPLARGGSQAISDALASYFRSLGGTIETNRRIEDVRELGDSKITLLDLTAWQAARVAGSVLPARYREKIARFPHGPSVFKIDYALDAPIRGPPSRVTAPARCTSAARSRKSPTPSARSRAESCPRALSSSSRNPAFSIPRARPPANIPPGPTPTFHAAARSIAPRASRRRSSASRPASASASSRATPPLPPSSRAKTRTSTAATSAAAQTICGTSSPAPRSASRLTARPSAASTSARPRPHPAAASTACAATTPRQQL